MADKVIDSLANRILELEDYSLRPTTRFASVNEGDTQEFVTANKNKNTSKATDTHIRLFQSWLFTTQNENRPVQDIPVDKLDTCLAQFFLSVRKSKRNTDNAASLEYEHDTLRSMQPAWSMSMIH